LGSSALTRRRSRSTTDTLVAAVGHRCISRDSSHEPRRGHLCFFSAMLPYQSHRLTHPALQTVHFVTWPALAGLLYGCSFSMSGSVLLPCLRKSLTWPGRAGTHSRGHGGMPLLKKRLTQLRSREAIAFRRRPRKAAGRLFFKYRCRRASQTRIAQVACGSRGQNQPRPSPPLVPCGQ
jgi:hypothetical protein